MNTKKGFTLIELLVVIAIISILAAILFPVFAQAREKARQTTCSSNLKQIGLGFVQYEQDNDECLPFGNASYHDLPGQVWEYGDGNGWLGQIYPYVKSLNVFNCPDDQTTDALPYTSYALNAFVSAGAGWAGNQYYYGTPKLITLQKLAAPSNTVALFEIYGCSLKLPTFPGGGYDVSKLTNETNSPVSNGQFILPSPMLNAVCNKSVFGCIVPRHDPTTYSLNWLFCDNHVKYLPVTKVSTGYTPVLNANLNSSPSTTFSATFNPS